MPGGPETGGSGVWWGRDGLGLFVTRVEGLRATVVRRDLTTGRRALWKEITPADPAGVFMFDFFPATDGQSYVYSYLRTLSSVQVVAGLG